MGAPDRSFDQLGEELGRASPPAPRRARCAPRRRLHDRARRAPRASRSARPAGSAAIGPASGVARGDAHERLQLRAHRAGVDVGRERRQAPLVEVRARGEEVALAAVERRRRRSCARRARPRDDAQDRVLELATRSAGHAPPPATNARGASQAPREVLDVGRRRRVAAEPVAGHEPTTSSRAAPASTRGASRSSASAIEPARGSSTWSAICGNGRVACSAGLSPPCWR